LGVFEELSQPPFSLERGIFNSFPSLARILFANGIAASDIGKTNVRTYDKSEINSPLRSALMDAK
jgi:hypothetical protein